jgi:HAD superfamily hydrolase (TIGR01509 family)
MTSHQSLPPRQIQAILFDLDGVLADSELLWNDIDAELLRECGVAYSGEDKAEVLGKSFALALGFYRDKYRLRPSIEELMLRRRLIAVDFYARRIMPYPQAAQVLISLREGGYRISLATSSVRPIVMPFLDRHRLTPFFDSIVTGEDVKNGKPNPDIYLRAAALLEVEPAHCLVVEDALAGVTAGKGAGALVAAIPDARFARVADYTGKADYILSDLGQLLALVQRLS